MKVTSSSVTYMLVYVYDIIITCSSPKFIFELKGMLHREFALKDLGALNYFLGIEVTKLANGCILLSQQKYITDLLNKAKMGAAKALNTPMTTSLKLSKSDSAFLHVCLFTGQ